MRDDKHIIEISGLRYSVQRTFSDEPAIYISAKPDCYWWFYEENYFIHISQLYYKAPYHTDIESVCMGMEPEEDVIIFAHRVEDIGKDNFEFLSDKKVKIDGKEYYIDLNNDNQLAIYVATKCVGKLSLFHLSDYKGYARSVSRPRNILSEIGNGINQVIIMASILDKPKLEDIHFLINGVETACGLDRNIHPDAVKQATRAIEDTTCENCLKDIK